MVKKVGNNVLVKQEHMSCDRSFPYIAKESVDYLLLSRDWIRAASSPDPQTYFRLPWCNEEDPISLFMGFVIGIGGTRRKVLWYPNGICCLVNLLHGATGLPVAGVLDRGLSFTQILNAYHHLAAMPEPVFIKQPVT